MDIRERAAKIKLLILDVDGVMTDGKIIYDNYGDEFKAFDVQDGYGLTLWWRAGLKSAIVTAKKSRIVSRRAKVCHITKAFMNVKDKGAAYEKLLRIFKITDEEACFIGDDLIDMPIMKRAGLAVAVPYSRPEVKSAAHYTTNAGSGRGAIRELIEIILKAQNKWPE
ncbi:MAG: HAD-IIIA family hydrolase [Candidatus Omnitrophota bacterium]|jgi:3-deoxy-D-manno-octulosonate 8-phosphate phosphatase (KDO 8-P phosphatase)